MRWRKHLHNIPIAIPRNTQNDNLNINLKRLKCFQSEKLENYMETLLSCANYKLEFSKIIGIFFAFDSMCFVSLYDFLVIMGVSIFKQNGLLSKKGFI